MELQLPVPLQIALYVATGCIIVFTVGLVIGLLYIRTQINRILRSVEDLKGLVEPLVQETRVAVQNIRSLTARVQEKWLAVETVLETMRSWGLHASRLIKSSSSAVTAPVHEVSRRAQILMKGMQTFFQVLLSRTP